MLHRAALVRTDVSEERIASNIRVKRIGMLGTTLAVTLFPAIPFSLQIKVAERIYGVSVFHLLN
jgi:hypothetical protein